MTATLTRLSDAEHEALAQRLFEAARTGKGIDPPSETLDYSFHDAYRIRRCLVDKLIAAGGQPRGHKIGFTSEAMQKMYGMTGPDFGILLDNMFVPSGRRVRVSHMANTRAEPELAFELGQPLEGPGVTIEQALAATVRVWPAVEIIDSRVGAMRAKANDSLADNAGAGWVVLGEQAWDPRAIALDDIEIRLTIDGQVQAGRSTDVMGHPAAPLAWLANKLPELQGLGGSLKAGDIVITGSPVRSVAVQAGASLDVSYGKLGHIHIDFA